MQVQSLGQEDPLEEQMTTHSGILAWEIPWTEEPGGLQSMGQRDSDTTEHPHTQEKTEVSFNTDPYGNYYQPYQQKCTKFHGSTNTKI